MDILKVQTEGVERLLRVGAAGSVGIGTDDPDSTLHIDGELRISNGTEDNIMGATAMVSCSLIISISD